MSNSKPKSAKTSAQKIFDVSKPGKSAPAASGRPIIITNRPVLKDPMVTTSTTPPGIVPVTEQPAPSKPRTKITVTPINEELEASVKSLSPALEVAEVEPAKLPAEPTFAEEPKAETEKAEVQTSAPEVEAPTEVPEPVEAAPAPDEPIKESVKALPAAKPAIKPSSAAVATIEPDETPQENTETADAQKTSEKEDEAAIRAELERQAELQKVVESKKYFLPINSVEKRRNKRDILLGLLFVLILAVVWADVALDAGMVHIHGVKALTHFFGK